MRRAAFLALVLLAAASCSILTDPEVHGVDARFAARHLLVTNDRATSVYYFAIDRDEAARVLWVPCTDPATCPRVDPGRGAAVAEEDVAFWDDGSKAALLYWWHLVPAAQGGFQPDTIRALVVPR